MVGIVLITHCNLGKALLEAATFISGKVKNVQVVSVQDEAIDDLRKAIAEAIEKVNKGKGVLILTDMFGGTPSNLSYSFLEPGEVEMITGVNLPMLLGAINKQKELGVKDLAAFVKEKARNAIILASEELNQ